DFVAATPTCYLFSLSLHGALPIYVAHLLVIAVDPGCQGSGAGTQLLRRCEQEAIKHGLPAIVLEVRQSNENAKRFYFHRGFEQLDRKSTRLNSSHVKISYAVFCLK